MSRLDAVPITPELDDYITSLLPDRDPVLARMEREIEETSIPGVGPAVGQLLALLVRMNGCRDVVELGCAIGYSAIWLARGCSGTVTTLEMDPDRAARARANFREAGLADRVQVVEADGLEWLRQGDEPFDCVFNDLLNSMADEAAVERCLEDSLRRLRPGGLLLADNALRRGEVPAPKSRGARNVARYNELVAGEARLESLNVRRRDSVSIARLR